MLRRHALAGTAASYSLALSCLWLCQFWISSWPWPPNDLDLIDLMITWDYKWTEIALGYIAKYKRLAMRKCCFYIRLGKYWVMTLTSRFIWGHRVINILLVNNGRSREKLYIIRENNHGSKLIFLLFGLNWVTWTWPAGSFGVLSDHYISSKLRMA